MNYVRLASYVWIAYLLINLVIVLADGLVAVFLLALSITGIIPTLIGSAFGKLGIAIGWLIGMLVGASAGAYAAYRFYKWLDRRVREVAANKLRQLGFNVEPRDMGFLAYRYYLMLLPTPEVEGEFRGRFGELRARYTSALTAAIVAVGIYVAIFTLIYVANVLAIYLFVLLATQSWLTAYRVMWGLAPLAGMPLIGLISGVAYASEELKTVVLRRPETTVTDVKKVLSAIGQGVLDAVLY